MKTRDSIAFCTALIFATCVISRADAQIVDREKFNAYIASPLHKGLLARAIAGIPAEVFQKCPTLKSPASQINVARPITFGPDGVPNTGAWWQHLPVSGCGNDTTLNILYEVAPDGVKINSLVTFPGSTRADLRLQKDALLFATVGAGTVVKDCKPFNVSNTRFEAFGLKSPDTPDPGPDAPHRPWWETWTMVGCGRHVDVTMDFTPDDTGTRISVPVGSAVER